MEHKNKPAPVARIWALYLIVGVLFMAGVVFFSNWKALCATEERFCQILAFVKSQSTRYEKYNDTVAAKTLRRTAVSVQALADDPALDFSDPQCLKKETERLWLTGISVLDPEGTLLCEYTANGVGYARFGDQLRTDAALDVFRYPQKTYMKRVLLEDGSVVDVTAHRAGSGAAILLTYRYTPAALVEGTALSVQSILDGYPEETSGTLFIVQNNQVIASNRPELIGQDTTDSPTVQEIRKVGVAEMLTHTRGWDGSGSYFGMYSHGRTFDLYAYTDGRTIFRASVSTILMALAGYILLVVVLQTLRRRSAQEMEQQKKEFQYELTKNRLVFQVMQESTATFYPGKQNPLYQDLEEMDHSKENAFTVTMEQMKSMRFIQNYRDEFLELNEKEKRGTFSWENLDLAVITNSDYIMEKMLQETELSNISGSYLSDHKKAMNQGIPLDFKKNKIFFGYIRRKNDETDELMDEFLEFLAEKLKGKTVNERTEE